MLLAGAYRAQPQRSLQRAWLGSGSGSSPVSCTRRRRSVSAQPDRCAPEASFCRLARCMARRRRSGHTAAWLRTGPCTYPCELSNSLSHHPRARAPAGNAGVRGDHAHVPPCSTTNTRHAHAKQSARWMPAGRPGGSGTQHAGALSGSAGRSAAPARTREGGGLRPASAEMRDPPAHRAGQPAHLLPPALAASHRLPCSSCVRSEIDRRSPRVSTRRPARWLFARAGCAGCAGHWLQTRGSSPHRQFAGHFIAIEAPVGATALRRRLPLPRRYSPMCRLLQLV
jgi:hypothetical protein